MVAPTASPSSGISGSLLVVDSFGGCAKCAVLLGRIRELECQLEEETKAKESMAECLDNTFASLTTEFENHKTKDARVTDLTAKLQEATNKLQAKSQDEAAKKFAKSMNDYSREILADKTSLRVVLDKVKEVESGQTPSEISTQPGNQHLLDQVEFLKTALETANLKVSELEGQPQDAATNSETPTGFMAIKPKTIKSEVEDTLQLITDGTQQSPTKDVVVKAEEEAIKMEVNNLSSQLLKAQRANFLLKNARRNADRTLSRNFRFANQQLHQTNYQLQDITQHYWQLVQDSETTKCNLLNTVQERDCLRNHINHIVREKENLGVRMAEANRKVSENRVSEQNLKKKIEAQREQIERLREQRKSLEKTIGVNKEEIEKLIDEVKTLIEENCELQKMTEHPRGTHHSSVMEDSLYRDSTPFPEPTTPRSPMAPKTPSTPESPMKRGSKRRSDENECGGHKKQKQ